MVEHCANVNSITFKETILQAIYDCRRSVINEYREQKEYQLYDISKRSQDHGVTTWHAKSLPDFD